MRLFPFSPSGVVCLIITIIAHLVVARKECVWKIPTSTLGLSTSNDVRYSPAKTSFPEIFNVFNYRFPITWKWFNDYLVDGQKQTSTLSFEKTRLKGKGYIKQIKFQWRAAMRHKSFSSNSDISGAANNQMMVKMFFGARSRTSVWNFGNTTVYEGGSDGSCLVGECYDTDTGVGLLGYTCKKIRNKYCTGVVGNPLTGFYASQQCCKCKGGQFSSFCKFDGTRTSNYNDANVTFNAPEKPGTPGFDRSGQLYSDMFMYFEQVSTGNFAYTFDTNMALEITTVDLYIIHNTIRKTFNFQVSLEIFKSQKNV
jgi:hypothetical protein